MKFSLAFVAILALNGAVRAGPVVIKSSSELDAVFEEFLDLVPVEPVTSIVTDYFINDPEIHRALKYIASEDFKNFVREFESIEDIINIYAYVQESGVDVYGAIDQLHAAIGLPPLESGKPTGLRTSYGGIAGLVDAIKAVLPLDDIKALYYEKLETSPAFAQLIIRRIHTQEFQDLINKVYFNRQVFEAVNSATAAGLDIPALFDLFKTIFGLNLPTLTEQLQSDFLQFLNALPGGPILDIHGNYLDNDFEFQEIGRYVRTEEFAQKLQELESIKEVRDLINFLQDSYINIHRYLELLHYALEMPPFEPTSLSRNTGGLAGYVAEIKAVLPTEEIKALHQERLQNSLAFSRLSKRLASPEFYDTVVAVQKSAQARTILAVFKTHGIDFLLGADLFASIFGFNNENIRNIGK